MSAFSLFAAKLYGVELSFAALLLCLLNAVILSIATPPAAGGGACVITMMLMQLGVPLEACTLAIAADAILEFPATAVDPLLTGCAGRQSEKTFLLWKILREACRAF